MCDNKGETRKDWGTKCTIDAKKLWKIFFITPGDGITSNIKVGLGRVGQGAGAAVLCLLMASRPVQRVGHACMAAWRQGAR